MYLRVPIPPKCKIEKYARKSKDEQSSHSIEDQSFFIDDFLKDNGAEDPQIELLSDEGFSGELRHRPGIDEVKEGIRKKRWDIIIAEDSSRFYRSIALCLELVGMAVDAGIRVICINDQVDTCNEDWQQRLEEAQRHHGQDNYYTRLRIKRAQEGLWRSGAAVGPLRPGYKRHRRDPDKPKSPKFDEIDPQWVPVIKEAFRRVASAALRPKEADLEDVAQFFTAKKLPKPHNSKSDIWSAKNVITLIRCEQYRGVEFYRKTVTKKTFKTGKWDPIPNPNPEKVLQREMPHLRMVDDSVWYVANKVIDDRARPGIQLSGKDHSLFGIPRNSRNLLSNIFVCGICGNKMYAEGRNEGGYRCSAASRGTCWNKATCLRNLVHESITAAVTRAILEVTPGVIEVVLEHIEFLLKDQECLRDQKRELEKRRSELRVKQNKFLHVILDDKSPPDFITSAIEKLKSDEERLRLEEHRLHMQLSERKAVQSRQEIADRFKQIAETIGLGEEDAKPLLKRVLDGPVRAVPYQPFGNSNVVLRGEFTLQLARLMPDEVSLMLGDACRIPGDQSVLIKSHSIDLFVPSKPQEHAFSALEFYRSIPEQKPTLEQIGAHLGVSKRTAHLALQLGKQLEVDGRSDQFVRLMECPANPARWRFKSAG